MLVSSNKKDGEKKFILKYDVSQDGIMAWTEFLRGYDNKKLEEVRMNKLKSLINIKYHSRYPGGFFKYIDTLQAHPNKLDILLPGQYGDEQKKRILFRSIKGDRNLRFLIQLCKDQRMSYQKAATYLRVHGAKLDKEL